MRDNRPLITICEISHVNLDTGEIEKTFHVLQLKDTLEKPNKYGNYFEYHSSGTYANIYRAQDRAKFLTIPTPPPVEHLVPNLPKRPRQQKTKYQVPPIGHYDKAIREATEDRKKETTDNTIFIAIFIAIVVILIVIPTISLMNNYP